MLADLGSLDSFGTFLLFTLGFDAVAAAAGITPVGGAEGVTLGSVTGDPAGIGVDLWIIDFRARFLAV